MQLTHSFLGRKRARISRYFGPVSALAVFVSACSHDASAPAFEVSASSVATSLAASYTLNPQDFTLPAGVLGSEVNVACASGDQVLSGGVNTQSSLSLRMGESFPQFDSGSGRWRWVVDVNRETADVDVPFTVYALCTPTG